MGALLVPLAAAAQVDWTMISGSGAPPLGCGFAWDANRERLVAFGGIPGGLPDDTTYEWDGSAWVVQNPAQRPSARLATGMAYDAARQNCVLFGGVLGPAMPINETWTWNGTTWTQRFPANAPSPRTDMAMAYDSGRQVVVLFGGWMPTATMPQDSNQTWEWNGTTWVQRSSAGGTPAARQSARMVFDAARGVAVMCGGYSNANQVTLGDTWTWNGTAWTQVASVPVTMHSHVLAYDGPRQRVVLWGGRQVLPGPVVQDLDQAYEWDGSS